MDSTTQTEPTENGRHAVPNDAVAVSHATADSANVSPASPSTVLPLSTSPHCNFPTPVHPTPGTTILRINNMNCASPDERSGGSVAAPDIGSCSLDDSRRPTPGNELQSTESRQLQSLLQQPTSQASHPTTTSQQHSQQRCQQPTLTPGSSAEHIRLKCGSVPSGVTSQTRDDNRR